MPIPSLLGLLLRRRVTASVVNLPTQVQNPASVGLAANAVTATFAGTPVAGNLLVAVGRGEAAISGASITGWTLAVSAELVSGKEVGIWYRVAGVSESTSVTLNWTGSGSTYLKVTEWNNISATPLDKTVSNPDGPGGTTQSTGTTATTTVATEVVVAVVGTANDATLESWSNGFTPDTSHDSRLFASSKVVTSTGAYETTLSWTTSRLAGGAIATFKGA